MSNFKVLFRGSIYSLIGETKLLGKAELRGLGSIVRLVAPKSDARATERDRDSRRCERQYGKYAGAGEIHDLAF